jgi:uncharacterized YigZ family protein
MLFEDTYKTVEKTSEGVFRDRGSKFIAYIFPIRSEEETKELLQKVKSEHPKARHHCWAYRLSPDRSVFRLNDDGEPSGTAGRPILNTLLSFEVTNVFAVVVRYFGGTLLGVPGLINAYKSATIEALQMANIIEKTVNDIYEVEFEYLNMNDVMRIIKEENLELLNQQFDNECKLELSVRKTQVNQVIGKLEKIENIKLSFVTTL